MRFSFRMNAAFGIPEDTTVTTPEEITLRYPGGECRAKVVGRNGNEVTLEIPDDSPVAHTLNGHSSSSWD